MTKPARHYYSVAVNHPDLPGAYLASFALPNQMPMWVMEGKSQKIFTCPITAEVAGFRVMMSKLNHSLNPQTFQMKNADKIRVARPTTRPEFKKQTDILNKIEADAVFARFSSKKTSD